MSVKIRFSHVSELSWELLGALALITWFLNHQLQVEWIKTLSFNYNNDSLLKNLYVCYNTVLRVGVNPVARGALTADGLSRVLSRGRLLTLPPADLTASTCRGQGWGRPELFIRLDDLQGSSTTGETRPSGMSVNHRHLSCLLKLK